MHVPGCDAGHNFVLQCRCNRVSARAKASLCFRLSRGQSASGFCGVSLQIPSGKLPGIHGLPRADYPKPLYPKPRAPAPSTPNANNASTLFNHVLFSFEVGTGSGPTLEFYAQVAENLRIGAA